MAVMSRIGATPRMSGVGVSGGSTLNPDGSMAAIGVNPFDQTLQSAKELAKQDPRIVANVVKGWVGGNER